MLIQFMFLVFLAIGWFPVSRDKTVSGSDVDYRNFRKVQAYQKEIDFNHTDFDRINQVVFHLTNEIRVKNNLNPLEYSPELEKSAFMHATDMVKDNFFNHINIKDSRKRTPNDRARLCNISNPFLAENLIEGYGLQYTSYEPVYLRGKGMFSKSPEGELIKAHTYLSFAEEQLKRWMDSKEHRKNILSKDALQIGCGTAIFINKEFNDMPSFYVVQNFQWYEPIKRSGPGE